MYCGDVRRTGKRREIWGCANSLRIVGFSVGIFPPTFTHFSPFLPIFSHFSFSFCSFPQQQQLHRVESCLPVYSSHFVCVCWLRLLLALLAPGPGHSGHSIPFHFVPFHAGSCRLACLVSVCVRPFWPLARDLESSSSLPVECFACRNSVAVALAIAGWCCHCRCYCHCCCRRCTCNNCRFCHIATPTMPTPAYSLLWPNKSELFPPPPYPSQSLCFVIRQLFVHLRVAFYFLFIHIYFRDVRWEGIS